MYTINEDHMNYGSWDIRHDGQSFLSFWAIFCPFTPFTPSLKKWKNQLKVSSFYTSIPKTTIICYTVPEIWYVMDVNDKIIWCMVPEIWSTTDRIFFFHLGHFLPFYPPNSPKNQNQKKKERNAWIYHHFTHVHQKLCSDDVRFLRYGARRTDGRTDGRKKWHTEVGAPSKKLSYF